MRRTKKRKYELLLCPLMIFVPACCLAAKDEGPHRAESEVRLDSSSATAEGRTRDETPDAPSPRRSKREDAGHLGLGMRLSTLGAGAEVAVSLNSRVNVRGGFNIFQYSRGFNHDGIIYKGQLNLRSGEAHVDWYPLGYAFHLSPGLLLYNGNGATATANVPGGSTFTLGGATYTSDPANPVTGRGKLDFLKVAPTAMFGLGNLVPPTSHFTFNFDMGVAFQGSARSKLNLAGSACDATGAICVNAATDPTIQANVLAEQTKINNKLSPFKYYPIISFGFGYRF